MTDTRSKGAATWICGAIYLACFYVMSFGPACRLVARDTLPARAVGLVYAPMLVVAFDGPPALRNALVWYARLSGGEQGMWDMKYQ